MGVKNGQQSPLIGKTRLELNRTRKNKTSKKILHSSSSPKGAAWISANHQLFDYDHLIAIDTNTKKLGESSVSITAAFYLRPDKGDGTAVYCDSKVLALIEMWNVTEKPENVGWWQILQALDKNPEKLTGNIGLIVDSDLGNHEAFNKRQKPILGDYFLPENVTINYGSDSGGAEHLSTKLIKYCHDLADDLYQQENLVLTVSGMMPGVEGLYSHFRQWDISNRVLRPFTEKILGQD